jgi:hypothetical protein
MWQVKVICSDEDCAELTEVLVEDLEEVEAVVCECGYSVVVLAVASFEPMTAVA